MHNSTQTQTHNKIEALAFHLSLAMMHGINSNAVLPSARNVLPFLNPKVREKMRLLLEKMPQLPNGSPTPNVLHAVQSESYQRLVDLLNGLNRYQIHPYRRVVSDPPPVWRKGTAQLLDYGFTEADDKPVVLFIPSLINRHYILDLMPDCSLIGYLKRKGYHCYAMDWGAPGPQEEHFSCDQYITNYLAEAVALIADRTQKRIVLAGYCMGGLLATAFAQIMPDDLVGLALFATPWNFWVDEFPSTHLDADSVARLESLIAGYDPLPADVIHALFYCANPWIFDSKFRSLAQMKEGSPQEEHFVALEQWVNDGVPMAQPLARECLVDWAQHNVTARYQWRIGGQIIDPSLIDIPAFIAAPKSDAIVPHSCSTPLAELLPDAVLHEPPSGHVSMIVGHRAKQELWRPLVGFLDELVG